MSLEELRKRIDEIDEQLVNLLNERAGVVVEIGKLKAQAEHRSTRRTARSRCWTRS